MLVAELISIRILPVHMNGSDGAVVNDNEAEIITYSLNYQLFLM